MVDLKRRSSDRPKPASRIVLQGITKPNRTPYGACKRDLARALRVTCAIQFSKSRETNARSLAGRANAQTTAQIQRCQPGLRSGGILPCGNSNIGVAIWPVNPGGGQIHLPVGQRVSLPPPGGRRPPLRLGLTGGDWPLILHDCNILRRNAGAIQLSLTPSSRPEPSCAPAAPRWAPQDAASGGDW